jgi:hypothetical protein
MSLHKLSKEVNVTRSLKKFFLDVLGTAVTFDVSLAAPDTRTQGNAAVLKWYSVSFGSFGLQALNEYFFEIYCLSREDPEGDELAEMADIVKGLLVDSTFTDGMKRIPLYDVTQNPWEVIAQMIVQDFWDATPTIAVLEDETKFKLYSVRLRWGAAQ